jgi:hypothetical protein
MHTEITFCNVFTTYQNVPLLGCLVDITFKIVMPKKGCFVLEKKIVSKRIFFKRTI